MPLVVRGAVAGLVLLCLLVFARAVFGDFVYDDELLLAHNPQLSEPRAWLRTLTEPLWATHPSVELPIGYWRPLTSLVLAIGFWLGSGGPIVLHAIAIAIHVGAVVTAFALLRRWLGDDRFALVGAALFAFHPVQVESVAWIAAVNDPLAGLCVLLSVWSFLRWRDGGEARLPWGAVGWFSLGLLAKETALVALPLLLLVDLADPGRRVPARRGLAAGVFLGISLAWLGLRMAVFGGATGGFAGAALDHGLPVWRQVLVRPELFGAFLGRLLLPRPGTLFPEFRAELVAGDPSLWLDLGLVLAYAAVLGLGWRRPLIRLGLLWLPLALLPPLVLTMVIGPFALADRYLYVATLGPALAVAALAARLRPAPGLALGLGLSLGAAVWSALAVGHWRSREALFRQAAARSPDSPSARYELGRALLDRWTREQDRALLEEARTQLEVALEAFVAAEAGVARFSRTRRVDVELALAWCRLGFAQLDRVDPRPALVEFERLCRQHPRHAPALTGHGVALAMTGQAAAAELQFRAALAIDPRDPRTRQNLARLRVERAALLQRAGQTDAARAALREALVHAPGIELRAWIRARLERLD